MLTDKWVIELDKRIDDYRIVVAFNGVCGFRCGYIGIQPNQPYYGYNEDKLSIISCHGNISYAEDNLPGINDNEDLWWIGFHCGEQCDGIDYNAYKQYFGLDELTKFLQENKSLKYHTNNVRSQEFVIDELMNIIKQLKSI